MDSTWFLGEAPVEYCIQQSDTFPIPKARAKEMVREALSAWKEFFRKYQLDQMEFTGLEGGKSLKLALDFKEVDECFPSMGQLVFLLGKKTPALENLLDSRQRTVGLAFRDETVLSQFRKGGSVYIANFLAGEPEFKHVLRHELGHVFGMKHNSVAIMSENVAEVLLKGAAQPLLGQIETSVWPYRLLEGDEVDFSQAGRAEGKFEPNFLLTPLNDILKIPREGQHSLKLKLASVTGDKWNVELKFQNAKGPENALFTGTLRMRKRDGNPTAGVSGPVLFAQWQVPNCDDLLTGRRFLDHSESGIEAEGALTFNGKTYPAILEARPQLNLKIFLPDSDQWWSTSNYSGVSIWKP